MAARSQSHSCQLVFIRGFLLHCLVLNDCPGVGLPLERATTAPSLDAALVSVPVPCDVVPPVALVGFNASEDKFAGGGVGTLPTRKLLALFTQKYITTKRNKRLVWFPDFRSEPNTLQTSRFARGQSP